jgi:hypothetical protein
MLQVFLQGTFLRFFVKMMDYHYGRKVWTGIGRPPSQLVAAIQSASHISYAFG